MKLKTLLPIVLLFAGGCYELTEFDGVPIRQYADDVIDVSSEWHLSPGTYSASRVLGKENVFPLYGTNGNAWSPLEADEQREYLVLGFDTAQTVITIQIYETAYPGSIDTVYLRNAETGKWKRIYSKPAEINLPEQARIKSIFLVETQLVDAIRIALNSPAVANWSEIDAVAITGQRKKE